MIRYWYHGRSFQPPCIGQGMAWATKNVVQLLFAFPWAHPRPQMSVFLLEQCVSNIKTIFILSSLGHPHQIVKLLIEFTNIHTYI